jgi:hypothetical protein
VDRYARLGELETVPEVLEAYAFLDHDLKPSFSAPDEELFKRDGVCSSCDALISYSKAWGKGKWAAIG